MKKRAQFFTIMAIYIISFFIISYTTYSAVSDNQAIHKRISTMNSFIFSLDKDISRQIYISGYRAILSSESYINTKGTFLNSSEKAIEEALMNGTINNETINLMENYKISDWETRISDLGSKTGLDINYSVIGVTVTQKNPWTVTVSTNITLIIQDKGKLASWNKSEIISSDIEIIGFEDPVYLLNTNGKVTNKIDTTIYQPFVSGTDVTNLSKHVTHSSYIESADAPSFLMRLEGNLSPNIYGIESFINASKLSEQGIVLRDKSFVDHIYFSSDNPTPSGVVGMPSGFKIDAAHFEKYNVTGLTY